MTAFLKALALVGALGIGAAQAQEIKPAVVAALKERVAYSSENRRAEGIVDELTVRDKGPVVRAEASASDRYAALDAAATKLLERLRRSHDRKKGKAVLAAPGFSIN